MYSLRILRMAGRSLSRSMFWSATKHSPSRHVRFIILYSELLEGTVMGHYCRICGRERPNEQFSGKGHRIHVCKRCKARPKSERQAIEDKDDIFAFLEQSHIYEKNVVHLERMAKSDNPQVASLAAIVLDVARVKPYKTRRLKFLAQKHPELLGKLRNTGLILD